MWNATVPLSPFSPLIHTYFPITLFIFFISKDKKWKRSWFFWTTLVKKILPPVAQMVKWCTVCNVIHYYTSVTTSIERCSKWLVSFLPSSIPQLQCHRVGISTFLYFKLLRKKIATNSRLITLWDCFADVILYYWCLTHTNKK